ncbi:hypothetical protein PR048_026388 [Dryococelus australis]|uniref:Uncharacterized protein n=1 Tax=Dryococelus australis TaxID=614101 RepID=A0ABQ9GL83_9NEOP|nr:hypothetical protein PR048_026388 [Dryococelus australis]
MAERLARSPPTKANQVQSPAGPPEFRKWESSQMMPLASGFSRGSPVSPAPSFQRCFIFTSITLIFSQDHAVKSRPNLFTHSGNMELSFEIWAALNSEVLRADEGEMSLPKSHRVDSGMMPYYRPIPTRPCMPEQLSPISNDISACRRDVKFMSWSGLGASQKQSSDTHKTPYDRVKRCRERKINIKAFERVNADWLDYSFPTWVKRVRFSAGLLPDFCRWESCRMMPPAGGFSRGSLVSSPLLSLKNGPIFTTLYPHLKTSILIDARYRRQDCTPVWSFARRDDERIDAHVSVTPSPPTFLTLRRAKFLQPGDHLNTFRSAYIYYN